MAVSDLVMTEHVTPIIRYYIDVRPYMPETRGSTVELPLIDTLPKDQIDKIKAFVRPADRLMSLASALLKYAFIHRFALIPWDEVRISRTPDPHRRPYWKPDAGSTGEFGLEFNVSHQNGLVVLLGCKTPQRQNQDPDSTTVDRPSGFTSPTPDSAHEQVRLGVDIACANEHGRTPGDITTQAKLDEWVDIFEEMFSESCRNNIKNAAIPNINTEPSTQLVQQRFRRFYAFWALKEAYIKMVGEGLLADWLSKLEFDNVTAPHPARPEEFPDDGFTWALRDDENEELKWTPPEHAVKNITASLYGQKLTDVKLSLVAYETDFLCATATRGVQDSYEGTAQERWVKLEFERDIAPCARGQCKCFKNGK